MKVSSSFFEINGEENLSLILIAISGPLGSVAFSNTIPAAATEAEMEGSRADEPERPFSVIRGESESLYRSASVSKSLVSLS